MVLGGFTIVLGLGILGWVGVSLNLRNCNYRMWLIQEVIRRAAFMSLRCLKVPDGVEYFSIHDVQFVVYSW